MSDSDKHRAAARHSGSNRIADTGREGDKDARPRERETVVPNRMAKKHGGDDGKAASADELARKVGWWGVVFGLYIFFAYHMGGKYVSGGVGVAMHGGWSYGGWMV